ncbi:xanthine dehydrogenase YagT iron-sulfur-binding subunit [Variovorax sp. 54]|uniref:aldehyde dehydrogenase iron-sulfur subunit PaoA n=1 Tax=Variovorax sp. 54 TaxID=2035212 RepID=UPI000C17F569|nr:aldehyde dehydrogenase iron-sulfur subunit PaoA [Variovorax sp. 54]PIF78792.1 xanthine dehydrogenase YagT iron-sulfur-binding subunit [Variovorax sp. 54]
MSAETQDGYTRRTVLASGAAGVAAVALPLAARAEPVAQAAAAPGPTTAVSLRINGALHALSIDPRVTLLDLLREQLHLTGSKKGCDHGQCGACTVLVNGRRINSCLTLAVLHEGDAVTTIEGLGEPKTLHPMQAAFVKHDGYQCGYCTPGQICSAVGMLGEMRGGMPSHVTHDLAAPVTFSHEEMRERMSGNICRCAGYPNIIAAIREVAGVAA